MKLNKFFFITPLLCAVLLFSSCSEKKHDFNNVDFNMSADKLTNVVKVEDSGYELLGIDVYASSGNSIYGVTSSSDTYFFEEDKLKTVKVVYSILDSDTRSTAYDLLYSNLCAEYGEAVKSTIIDNSYAWYLKEGYIALSIYSDGDITLEANCID